MRKKRYLLLIVIVGIFGLSFTTPSERYFEIAKNLDIFATLFKEVNALYVDDVNPNTLVRTGIDAMLVSLDPYTNYIPEDEVEDYRTMNTGQYGGIGAITRDFENRTVVTMIMQGFAAEKGGLKIGDEIVKVGQVRIADITKDEVNHLMKGQVGTPLTLTVKRYGQDKLIDLTFTREKIKVSNVPYYGMVSADVGFVQLSDFTPDAGKEVRHAVEQLKEQGAKSVILDLRGNPGGLLIEAVNIVNIFIPKGQRVVSTKGKVPDNNLSYETLNPPLDTEMPVAVLINRGSASASEIVAGTLQDYDRAIIVGERSYGKGLVQVSRPLSYNSQLKVTTAKYYTPTGRCIQVLDYSHRRDDGSVASIPDSLKKSFRTTNGRIVYDGGGIEPDLAFEQEETYPITQVLFAEGYFFDYATEYAHAHPTIPDARSFKLADAEYNAFVAWMRGKHYTYESELEYQLGEFESTAKKERYYEDLKGEIDLVRQQIKESRKNELMLYKAQIKKVLEAEIVSRYYFEKGSIEVTFDGDPDIGKAIEVLHTPAEYNKILNVK